MVQEPLPRVLLLKGLQKLPKETPHPRGDLEPWIRKERKGRKTGRDREGNFFFLMGKTKKNWKKNKRKRWNRKKLGKWELIGIIKEWGKKTNKEKSRKGEK